MKLTQLNFNSILEKNFTFEKKPKIAVAVSGGPDSMALVFLLSKWIKKNNGLLIALIVDHKIRQESEKESKDVKKYLSTKEINCKILKVKNSLIIKKTMNEARHNRYNLLFNFCKKNNIFHLFLGHQIEDNIETFLLRKIAGSNFDGLSSIKINSYRKSIQILRPFLFFKKSQILKYNNLKKIEYITDPSNKNINFSRVAIRNFLEENKFYKKSIIKDINLINYYYPYYKSMIFEIFHKVVIKTKENKIVIDKKNFFVQNVELQVKIIEIIYSFLIGNKKNLRYAKTTKTLDNLKKREEIKVNLSGMDIKKSNILISFTLQKS